MQLFVKFSPMFFGISQNFSDFDRSDAKIAILQLNVKVVACDRGNALPQGNAAAAFPEAVSHGRGRREGLDGRDRPRAPAPLPWSRD